MFGLLFKQLILHTVEITEPQLHNTGLPCIVTRITVQSIKFEIETQSVFVTHLYIISLISYTVYLLFLQLYPHPHDSLKL